MYQVQWLHDPVYVPSTDQATRDMVALKSKWEGVRVADVGSGNGKLVIAFAKEGAIVDGYENKWWLVWNSRRRIAQLGLNNTAQIKWQNFWQVNFCAYDVVILYTSNHLMAQLERKLWQELQPGAAVISNTFQFPHWPLKKQLGNVFLYEKGLPFKT